MEPIICKNDLQLVIDRLQEYLAEGSIIRGIRLVDQTDDQIVLLIDENINLDQRLQEAQVKRKLFVFEYLMGLTDPDRRIFSWLENNGFTLIEIRNFHGVGFVHIYERTNALVFKGS